jgi:acetyl esterase/lipase
MHRVTLDDDAYLAALDPGCVTPLLAIPPLEPSEDPVEMRRLTHAVADAIPLPEPPEGVVLETLDAGGDVPPLRVHRPTGRRREGAGLLWIHGGGLIAGAARYDDPLCARMAADHGCPVVAVDYRLAPEAPYPAALEDCLAAVRWATSDPSVGVEPGRLVVVGASAGGGLALGLAMLVRDRGLAPLAGLVCAYPMLDDRCDTPSMHRLTARRTWHRQANQIAWRSYLDGRDKVPAYAAPARADVDELRGLPPVHLDVGTLDAFLDENLDFAARLARADVAVELVVTPAAGHGSEYLNPLAPTSRRILSARRRAIARMLDAVAAS